MAQKLTTLRDHIITTSNNTGDVSLTWINPCREIPIETLQQDELLITITGLSGSGKSTMAELIREFIDLYGVVVDDRTEIAQRQKYGSYDTDRQSKMERVCAVMNKLKKVVIIEENGTRNFAR
tara:strand:+ start:557 stop:925 length:369 start_codon:yes stop_codon:yes gene_type:complete